MHSPLERIEKKGADFLSLLQNNAYIWLCFLFTLVLVLNGINTTDMGEFIPMSLHPFNLAVESERQFLYSSPINMFLAHLLGLESVFGFYVIHIGEIALMLFCVAFSVRHKIPETKQQVVFLTLLSLTPLWLIVIKWIGKPDPILIAGLFLCWAFRSRWRVAIALMMVLAHREAGSVMVAAFYLSEKKKDHNLFVSLLVGNALHMLYQYGMLDYAPESRPEVMLDKIPDFLRAIVNMPTLYVMSMLTWYWVIILKRGLTAAEAGVMLMAACMAFLLEDFTRDFILAALPALLFHAARLAQSSDGTAWKKLWPLAPLQFQIATLGHVAFTRNIFLDLILRSHGR